MKHEILKDGAVLRIIADERERFALKEFGAHSGNEFSAISEAEALEKLIANSELEWIDPAETGDLTSAPMLGIWGSEEENSREKSGPFGAVHVGGDAGGAWYAPIVARWAYMNYQVRSFLDDLIEKGHADFAGS
jgi:hypothetical protein